MLNYPLVPKFIETPDVTFKRSFKCYTPHGQRWIFVHRSFIMSIQDLCKKFVLYPSRITTPASYFKDREN